MARTPDVKSPARRTRLWLLALLPLAIPAVAGGVPAVGSYLPTAAVYLSYSFGRMVAAYALSLIFALGYGFLAATRRSYERILLPILDLLQSIPILAFFPAALVLFVGLTGRGSFLGPNLASVFLIFTSMSWNMAFGVYESIKGIPGDLREASDSFGVSGWRRLRRLLFPATANSLVYNSILSWTGGWFFLVASEIITGPSINITLPGIGSLLFTAALSQNMPELAAGLIVLASLIVAMDLLLWRPLGSWAERFRYDQVPSGEGAGGPVPGLRVGGRAAAWMARGFLSGMDRVRAPLASLQMATRRRLRPSPRPRERRWLRLVGYYALVGGVLVAAWLALLTIGVDLYRIFTGPISGGILSQIRLIPLAAVLSVGRLLAAYSISLAIALPLGIYLLRHRFASRYGFPAIQIIASFPATALFPLFLVTLLGPIGPAGVSILFLVTGMIWYLFFNLYSGLRALPPDLDEAGRSFGLKGKQYARRLLLPGIFSSYITGSITAFGGGWNTLILAEYLQAPSGGTPLLQQLGLGDLINVGYYSSLPGGLALMATALLSMVALVLTINAIIWKPLYRKAAERYRFD